MKKMIIKETKDGWSCENQGFNQLEAVGIFTVLRDNAIIEIINVAKNSKDKLIKKEE